jgi:hypothetical protein
MTGTAATTDRDRVTSHGDVAGGDDVDGSRDGVEDGRVRS